MNRPLSDLGVDVRITLEWILVIQGGKLRALVNAVMNLWVT